MAEMPRFLTASAEIAVASQDVMKRLCAHFAELGDATIQSQADVRASDAGFGTAALEACERCLKVLAAGKDDTSLAYVKLARWQKPASFRGGGKAAHRLARRRRRRQSPSLFP